jgi:hypothetical protein
VKLLLHGDGDPDEQTLALGAASAWPKLAVTFKFWVTERLHCGLVPKLAQAPPHPVKL